MLALYITHHSSANIIMALIASESLLLALPPSEEIIPKHCHMSVPRSSHCQVCFGSCHIWQSRAHLTFTSRQKSTKIKLFYFSILKR